MAKKPTHEITVLLKNWENGDKQALEELIRLLYTQLRKIAKSRMRKERQNHSLESAALVHEVFLEFNKYSDISWQNRAHFFAMASEQMRRILVDHARKHKAGKRGGDIKMVPLDEANALTETQSIDVLAIDEALNKLATIDPDRVRVVEMRFFSDNTFKEIGEVLGISEDKAQRMWKTTKLWLQKEITQGHA